MPLLIVIAALAIAGSIPLLWWALASGQSATRTNVQSLLGDARPVTDLREIALGLSATDRAVRPLVTSLADRVRRLSPAGWVDSLERKLVLAGRPAGWPLERVLAAKLLLGMAGMLVGALLFMQNRSMRGLLVWLGIMALSYLAPDLLLYSRGQERQKTIQRELPDTLDQMTIAVEAGLGFESAMARAGHTGKGPLAGELVRTLQEIQVGVARGTALRNLADRTNVPDLRQFVLAVVQAEGYGIPIADVLRVQAAELRMKRRQRAEERAMKIPVKILFPLLLCIFPTLFIVILGPAAIQISRTLLGEGGVFN